MKYKKILIITGVGNPAVSAMNNYIRVFRKEKIKFYILENKHSIKNFLILFIKSTIRYGLFHSLSVFYNRALLMFDRKVKKNYEAHKTVKDLYKLNENFFLKLNPDLIVTNGCALIPSKVVSTINKLGINIINLHNGICPRYRGSGNIWSIYEMNFEKIGVTIHYLDSGIDTGKIIKVKKINVKKTKCKFEDIDILAFKLGSFLIIDFILGKLKPSKQSNGIQRSKLYSFPPRNIYLEARKRYATYVYGSSNETSWLKIFNNASKDKKKNIFEKQSWQETSTVKNRDNEIKKIGNKFFRGNNLIDLGCGDGRYKNFFKGIDYWGLDFSKDIMQLNSQLKKKKKNDLLLNNRVSYYQDSNRKNFVVSKASKIPLKSNNFDNLISVGLFQHISNVGAVSDEIIRLLKKNGIIIINTLRQFSIFEILLLIIYGLINKKYLNLIISILKEDYFTNKIISGIKLARRFTLKEIVDLFKTDAIVLEVKYNGLFKTFFFSKEIFIVLKKK
jgi:SAM-dependent methyltransferase